MSLEEMPIMACSSSSGARLLGDWAGVGSWNEDLDPAVLGLPFGSLVVGDRRSLALAVGLEAIRLGQEGPEQGGDALGALDGQMVVVREADVAATDRRIVGMSDDFYKALFLVERAGDTARDRLELVEHGGRAGIEQDDVADPHGDLICSLLGRGVVGGDIGPEGGADALQLRDLIGFGRWRRWRWRGWGADDRELADVVERRHRGCCRVAAAGGPL